jgi:hypothetical protein
MEPQQTQVPPQAPIETTPKKSIGPIVGIIVIILLLVLGALYVWGGKLSKNEAPKATIENTGASAELSNSDEVDALESDLANTDLDIDLSGI